MVTSVLAASLAGLKFFLEIMVEVKRFHASLRCLWTVE